MARTMEPETEFDPRHRIVGAIILVTLAVIVLPLILDERPAAFSTESPTDETSIAGTEPIKASKVIIKKLGDDKPVSVTSKSEPIPAKAETKPQPKETKVVVKKLNTDKTTTSTASTSKPDTKTQAKTVTKTETRAPAPEKTTAAITKPHWAVQVGTFSQPGNVRRLSNQLKEHGYSLMLKDVNLKQGSAVRVRVGPYTSKASADRAQARIKQQIGVKGVVVAGP